MDYVRITNAAIIMRKISLESYILYYTVVPLL